MNNRYYHVKDSALNDRYYSVEDSANEESECSGDGGPIVEQSSKGLFKKDKEAAIAVPINRFDSGSEVDEGKEERIKSNDTAANTDDPNEEGINNAMSIHESEVHDQSIITYYHQSFAKFTFLHSGCKQQPIRRITARTFPTTLVL